MGKELLQRCERTAAKVRLLTGPLSGAAMLAFLAANLLMLKGEFAYDAGASLLPGPLAAAALLALPLLPAVYLAAALVGRAAHAGEEGRPRGPRARTLWAMGAAVPCLAYVAFSLINADHDAGRFQAAAGALRSPLFGAAYIAGPLAVIYGLKTALYRWLEHSGLRRFGGALAIKAAAMAAATVMFLSALLPLYFYLDLDMKVAELGGGIVEIR